MNSQQALISSLPLTWANTNDSMKLWEAVLAYIDSKKASAALLGVDDYPHVYSHYKVPGIYHDYPAPLVQINNQNEKAYEREAKLFITHDKSATMNEAKVVLFESQHASAINILRSLFTLESVFGHWVAEDKIVHDRRKIIAQEAWQQVINAQPQHPPHSDSYATVEDVLRSNCLRLESANTGNVMPGPVSSAQELISFRIYTAEMRVCSAVTRYRTVEAKFYEMFDPNQVSSLNNLHLLWTNFDQYGDFLLNKMRQF